MFAVNRSVDEPITVEVDVRHAGDVRLVEALTMANQDPYARATVEDDASLAPRPNDSSTLAEGRLRVELPPVSWSMLRLQA